MGLAAALATTAGGLIGCTAVWGGASTCVTERVLSDLRNSGAAGFVGDFVRRFTGTRPGARMSILGAMASSSLNRLNSSTS